MSDETTATEQWVYLGRTRLEGAATLRYKWRDASGAVLIYGKLKGSVIGGTYEVEVTRTEESTLVVPRVTYVPDVPRSEDAAVLEAADRRAYDRKARIDAEKRAERNSELDTALAPIIAVVKTARTYDDLEALIYVTGSKMRKAWNK